MLPAALAREADRPAVIVCQAWQRLAPAQSVGRLHTQCVSATAVSQNVAGNAAPCWGCSRPRILAAGRQRAALEAVFFSSSTLMSGPAVMQVNPEGTGIRVMHEHANKLVAGDDPDIISE